MTATVWLAMLYNELNECHELIGVFPSKGDAEAAYERYVEERGWWSGTLSLDELTLGASTSAHKPIIF